MPKYPYAKTDSAPAELPGHHPVKVENCTWENSAEVVLAQAIRDAGLVIAAYLPGTGAPDTITAEQAMDRLIPILDNARVNAAMKGRR